MLLYDLSSYLEDLTPWMQLLTAALECQLQLKLQGCCINNAQEKEVSDIPTPELALRFPHIHPCQLSTSDTFNFSLILVMISLKLGWL